MKYINKATGVILEPRSDLVESQMKNDSNYREYKKGEKPAVTGNQGEGEKPHGQMNKEELLAKAAELGIEVPDGTTNIAIVEMIKAKTQ